MSDVLREDHPFSMSSIVSLNIEDFTPALLALSKKWKDENMYPFAAAFALPNTPDAFWRYYQQNPAQKHQFYKGMINLESMDVPTLLYDYPWSEHCPTVVDIAGGRGMLLAGIINRAPKARGVLFDLSATIEQSQALWQEQFWIGFRS
jgi:hypothetical protein